jgi:hypothetical protein
MLQFLTLRAPLRRKPFFDEAEVGLAQSSGPEIVRTQVQTSTENGGQIWHQFGGPVLVPKWEPVLAPLFKS